MKALLAGFVLMLAASTALAADFEYSGWYIGGSGGQTSLENACGNFEAVNLAETCDDESVGWKVFAGKWIYKYTALELQYMDAGEARLTAPSATPGNLEINPRMASLFLRLEVPVAVQGRFGVFFKFGANYYDTEYKGTGSYVGVVPESDDGIDTALGGGFSWRFSKAFSGLFEWENFNDPVAGNGDVTLTSVGLRLHF
ncbi:MAG: porin family protein [Betaproteobacteria bacterium]|nr:MAG: porin family protein [Betaproteobacteria bacterium]